MLAGGYDIDCAACSGHTLHGWPCVHLYPWLKCMCPAAAVSCIIHDVSEFSTSWCLSVSTACPLSLPIHSPWMVMTSKQARTQPQKGQNTNSHRGRKHVDTLTCIHALHYYYNYTLSDTNLHKISHVCTPQELKWDMKLTFCKLFESSHNQTYMCMCVCAEVHAHKTRLPWRAAVRCLMTGRQSAAAAAEMVESLGRPLKAHRVLGVGSPDLVKAFPCSSTQPCFSSSCSTDSTGLIPHPNAEETH